MQECYSAPGISDHEIVLVTLEPETFYNSSKSYKVYLWDSTNLSELRENMCNFTREFCNQFCDETSMEILWTCLRDKHLFLLYTFVPSKLKNNNNRQPRHIKQLRRWKQASYNRARFTISPVDRTHYKELKDYTKECRRAFRKYMFNTLYDPYQFENGKKKRLFDV